MTWYIFIFCPIVACNFSACILFFFVSLQRQNRAERAAVCGSNNELSV